MIEGTYAVRCCAGFSTAHLGSSDNVTLNAPITTAADTVYYFQRKQVLTFHVNHLPSRGIAENVKTCFL